MEEAVAVVAAVVEEEGIPLEEVHMAQDPVVAYPYVPSCGVVAKWV
jgi:hypothetical protein